MSFPSFSHKQSEGHAFIRLMSDSLNNESRKVAFQKEGFDGDIIHFSKILTPVEVNSGVTGHGNYAWPPNLASEP